MEKYGVETQVVSLNEKLSVCNESSFQIGNNFCGKCDAELEHQTNYCPKCKEVPKFIYARVELPQ